MSTPHETLEELLTVTSSDSDLVHLALLLDDDVVAGTTLCSRRVNARLPVQRFQAAGCPACAEIGLGQGIKAAVEHGHAAVNIERFLGRWARRAGGARQANSGAPLIPQQPAG